MKHKQLHDLPKEDPLYAYLSNEIMPKILHYVDHAKFHVYRLHSPTRSNKVYLYEEAHTKVKFVGKFFVEKNSDSPHGYERAKKEFDNLMILHNAHLDCTPHKIVKPIACNPDLNSLLIIDYVEGTSLCKMLRHVLSHHLSLDTLFHSLSSLAYLLATIHNKTANKIPVNFNKDCDYFTHLILQLKSAKKIDDHEEAYFLELCEEWKKRPCMWEDNQVYVHGDATPPNFIFKEECVTAIDFERMKYADRIFDLGRIIGEIQHYFMEHKHEKESAEPLIHYFLWHYCSHFPNQKDAFIAITKRVPFQIAITLMRIARNSWIDKGYSHGLLKEAKKTLQGLIHAT